MTAPRLAILVPNYNHARLVGEALRSAFTQTRPPDEVIVVDDASTDDSLRVLSELAERYPALRVLRHDRNRGVVATANTALAATEAEYVSFLAADDLVAPTLYERSLALLAAYPKAGLCSALTHVIDEGGRPLGLLGSAAVLRSPGYVSPERARALVIEYGLWVVGTGCVYRRDSFVAVGGLRPELRSSADALPNIVLPLRYGACYIPEPLASLRITDRNFSTAVRRDLADRGASEEAVLALMVGEFASLFPPGYVAKWRRHTAFRFAIDSAAWRAPMAHGRPLDPPSSAPLRLLRGRLATDARLAWLLSRHCGAWLAARRQSKRIRASLRRAGFRDADLY